jgi:hypothetical protein
LKSPRTAGAPGIAVLLRHHVLPGLRQWFGGALPEEPETPVGPSPSAAAFVAPPATSAKKIVNGAKSISVRSTKMNFILTGFTEETGFRVFAFQGVGANGTRLEYTVKAHLGLSRTYGIRLQELPLLCRGMLDRLPEGAEARTVTFTEEGMRLHADNRAAERDAARKRKAPPRPPTEQAATRWRAAQP